MATLTTLRCHLESHLGADEQKVSRPFVKTNLDNKSLTQTKSKTFLPISNYYENNVFKLFTFDEQRQWAFNRFLRKNHNQKLHKGYEIMSHTSPKYQCTSVHYEKRLYIIFESLLTTGADDNPLFVFLLKCFSISFSQTV